MHLKFLSFFREFLKVMETPTHKDPKDEALLYFVLWFSFTLCHMQVHVTYDLVGASKIICSVSQRVNIRFCV